MSAALGAAWLLFWAQTADPPTAPDPAQKADERSEVEALWDRGLPERLLSVAEIEASIALLASRYPELAHSSQLGLSGHGRPLTLLSLTDPASGGAESKPAILFADASDGGSHGAELALALAWELLRRFDEEDALARELLAHGTVYVAPMLNPDQRARDLPADGVQFERNFPLGWQPGSVRPGSGAFPLSMPETESVVRFLGAHPNIALLLCAVRGAPRRGRPFPGAHLPDLDRDTLARLAGGGAGPVALHGWHELESLGGGLLDYAYQARGIYPLLLVQPQDLAEGSALSEWLVAAGDRVLGLARRLPRLEVQIERVERRAPEQWQVDLVVENRGAIPTLSRLGALHSVAPDLEFILRGLDLIAAARRHEDESDYRVAHALIEEPLAGGARVWLRVLVRGAAGDQLELAGGCPWTAPLSERIPLN